MPQEINHDVASIREWLAKEEYLPNDFDDQMLKKFLHSCYGSLEKTKKCIERFCITRTAMVEAYTDRDPLSPRVQTAFDITHVATYSADGIEVIIHQLDDPGLEKFNFYDIIKSFSLQADHWLRVHDFFPEGHIVVFDMKDYLLKIIAKVNIMFFRDFILYLLEGMPVRMKAVHLINCPPFYDKLYALVKPVLPIEIRNIIHFHPTVEGLHKAVNKKYLPVEYGGEGQSLKEQHKEWIEKIIKNRDVYLNDHMWKADLKKKPKGNVVENTMSGSFRTLSID